MYSPPAGGAARRPSATIDKQHTSKRRFIFLARMTIYADHEIPQVAGCELPVATLWARRSAPSQTAWGGVARAKICSYHLGSISPRTMSSHVWRFRMSANL